MWVGVLGALEARANTPVRLNSQRQRALLAVLTCHRGRSVSVDRLVEAIWEEEAPPQREKAAVQTVVSRLRTAIADAGGDPHVITSDDTGYRLVADATQVDASMFAALMGEGVSALSAGASDVAADALERAVGLFRGAPYEEFAHCAWAQGEATRLSERYADAVELLATALLDLGAHRELVPRLEEALDAYPYREGLQAALMTALYRCGRHTDALRSYRGFRDLLVEDLGLEPSPELSEHQGRILRHEVGLDAPPSGRPLRGYRLHEQIGSTHLGAVWRATQPGVGREVAITVVDGAAPAAPSVLTDFDTLAPCVGRLDASSISQIVDA
jgi:DNA-binding SARP family transcriptional activator